VLFLGGRHWFEFRTSAHLLQQATGCGAHRGLNLSCTALIATRAAMCTRIMHVCWSHPALVEVLPPRLARREQEWGIAVRNVRKSILAMKLLSSICFAGSLAWLARVYNPERSP
jgi:hypothetical protein